MFGADKLFAGFPRPHSMPTPNSNLFGYSCNNHPAPGLMPSHYGLPDDTLPMLFAAGGGNMFLKSAAPSTPTCMSGNASMCSNDSASSGTSPPNGCSTMMPPIETPKSPVSTRRLLGTPSRPASQFLSNDVEVFARKVFVGGLPIDVTEDEIWQTFSIFGNVLVDWPRRPDGTSSRDEDSGRGCEWCIALLELCPYILARSMTGYVFLVFEEERSVQYLVSECHKEDDR
ncbi:unnamed protein product [Strongylus vulgaris]|uniref:RRM domain-containing protein n=1 Tax=Strongylus vulgaris TaxID=40348 RepID=A0A3P7IQ91_STRVU|nr:unnamed protein product [Strongylus vulgaris]